MPVIVRLPKSSGDLSCALKVNPVVSMKAKSKLINFEAIDSAYEDLRDAILCFFLATQFVLLLLASVDSSLILPDFELRLDCFCENG